MRIGIVNDVPLILEALRRLISLQPRHRVLWTAANGADAVKLCTTQPPDLVLMDLLMPGMDGVEATRRIMAGAPCPILIVTISVGANVWRVFEAMGHGALDAVDTPSLGAGDLLRSGAPLLAKIDAMAHFLADKTGSHAAHERPRAAKGAAQPLVAIGASAGGPAALVKVLSTLPADFPAPVVIVQHVDAQFAPGMATWLGQNCRLPVRVACENDALAPGVVLLAGTGDHLVLKANGRLGYTPDPIDYVYRPSVDVFFQSLARRWEGEIFAALLTGMGRDGALGLKALRAQGHLTLAQDQATCAVYGMPKAAASIGAATEILPIDRVGPRLILACKALCQ